MYRYPLSIALSASIALGAISLRTHGFSSFTYETNRQKMVEAKPIELSSWQLQSANGNQTQLSELANQILLVDFVYTRCPTICRALGSRYQQLQRVINESGNENISLLSISIDPTFDSPKQLTRYQKRYSDATDSWQLARPVNDEAFELMISEVGLRIIPDEYGGLAHSDAIHLIESGTLTKIDSWDSDSWEKLIKTGTAN